MNAKEIIEVAELIVNGYHVSTKRPLRCLAQAYLDQSRELANYVAGERVTLTAIENLGDQILITEAVEKEFTALKERLKNPTEEMCVAGIGAVLDLGLSDTRVVRPVFKAMIDEANWKPNDGRKIDN